MRLLSLPILCSLFTLLLPAQTGAVRRTANPHGPLKIACESCHTASGWRPIRPQPEFDHNTQTSYPLRGMHEGVACNSCHVDRVFANAAHACSACHADIHRRQFGANCHQCHSVQGWKTAVRQNRDHFNRFPLIGAHSSAPCESCHKSAASGIFSGLSTECAACHVKDFQQAKVPPHNASFPRQCDQCHSMDSWKGAKFDHAAITKFALSGAHARLECRSCHTGGQFSGTPADCFSCHTQQFNATQNPNHVQAGFPRDCSTCHNTSQWKGAVFDHTARTKFALTGAHVQAQCSGCHVGGRFAGTPQNCDSCHLDAFNKTSNPNHSASNFPRDCSQCHTTTQWKGAKFDHNLSRFSLTGAHARVECASCHVGGRFTGTTQACEGCHMDAFNAVTSPNHVVAGFPKDCAQCHTTAQWKGAKFDHNTSTKFPLTGAHVQTQCNACHVGGSFAGTAQNCEGCHLATFNQTSNPNHTAAAFPKDCAICHTTTQWKGAKFDHATATRFPLTGAHASVQCTQCHVNSRYAGIGQTCEGCHLDAFNTAANPNHAAAGFPKDCAVCHTTTHWKGARFEHTTMTKFALTGAHVNTQCASCHKNNVFQGTAAACEGCHLDAFNKTTNPNHVSAGFPKDCLQCHTTSQWQGARFDHSKTKFALTGAHGNVQCASCHAGGKFAGTAQACEGCHLPAFNQAANPNHVSAGFPRDCAVCHTTTQWKGARFDHTTMTKFALTGAHVNTQCASCHKNNAFQGTPAVCEGCHLDAFNRTSNPNHVSAGFPKDCLQCHTTSQWQGAKFDHAKTKFALTGAHVNVQCAQCHVSGKYTGTTQTCDGCHLDAFNKTSNPNHVTAGFPKDCTVCHTTLQWKGARFDHTALTKFPLTGAHVNVQCAQCHKSSVFKGTLATCEIGRASCRERV